MMNWYRASVRRRPERLTDKRVHVPTLIIWGRRDVALSDTMVEPSAALCDDVRKAREAADIVVVTPHWGIHFAPAAKLPHAGKGPTAISGAIC